MRKATKIAGSKSYDQFVKRSQYPENWTEGLAAVMVGGKWLVPVDPTICWDDLLGVCLVFGHALYPSKLTIPVMNVQAWRYRGE